MKRNNMKRMLSIALALTVALTFTLMSTVTVDAAAKKKTVYQLVSAKHVTKSSSGTYTSEMKYTYDKKGLRKQATFKESGEDLVGGWDKSVIKRNKDGSTKEVKYYEGKKYVSVSVYKWKKGKNIEVKSYDIVNGKKKLDSTTTNKFSKGKLSKSTYKSGDYTSVTTYKKGVISKEEAKGKDWSSTTTYDKYGHIKKHVNKTDYSTTTATYKHTLNKKKDVVKTVETSVSKDTDGNETTGTSTTKSKYTYKNGNIVKEVEERETKSGDYTYKSKSTSTYKYKKFKVDKKYLKFIGKE